MRRNLRALLCALVSIVLPNIAAAQPIANFTSNTISGCSPIVVQFSDQSTGTPTSWSWNLGNSTTSNQRNPSTTYINPGTYTVSLTVSNGSGNDTKTLTNYITVFPSPIVAFTGDTTTTCAPKAVQFTNQSVPGTVGAASYLWDFGDGITSTQTNPVHVYNTVGNYSVTLIVTNSSGCNKSLTKNNYIHIVSKPIANFTSVNPTSCTVPFTTSFTNTSINAVSYDWNFGDGGTSTTANPPHTYLTTGNYTVRLIVTNATGCKDTVIKPAFISAQMVNATFTKSTNSICVGKAISFNNTSSPVATSSNWDFGDAGTSTLVNPSHAYNTAGIYSVRLISTTNSCADTDIQSVTVVPGASIQFSANNTVGCSVPFTTQFSNTSTNAVSYLWLFGDGTTSAQANPNHTYTTLGNYNVSLVATNTNGCIDTLTKPNFINVVAPTATITDTFSGCAPVNIKFYGNVNSLLPVTNYAWNFGDGSSILSCAACGTPTHTYATAGTYTVTLNYTTGAGCNFSTQTNITIGTKPVAAFTLNPPVVCPQQIVNCTNTSTGATNYIWSDNISTLSTTVNTSWRFSAGTYTITLHAINNGCEDTVSHSFTVNLPRASFKPSYQCSSRLNISFTDNSAGANTYSWNFGDGNTSTAVGSTSHTYAAYGTYLAVLTVTNNTTGCSDVASYILNLMPLISQFTANDTTVCPGDVVTFTGTNGSIYNDYRWDFGDGNNTTTPGHIVLHPYTVPGVYNVTLKVYDTAGCKDSITKVNYIHVGGAAANFSASPTQGCSPFNVNFTDVSIPSSGFAITNRKWNFGDGNIVSSSSATIGHLYNTPGTYSVTIQVIDANNCATDITKTNYITSSKPVPAFSASANTACIGQTINFTNSSTAINPSYNWNFGDGATSTLINPFHAYTSAGTYTVKLVITEASGCKDSLIQTSYIVINAPTLRFTMSDSVATCPPLAVNFTNVSTGAGNYIWDFNNNSTSTLTNPTTLYTYPGVYTVKLKGSDAFGCTDSTTRTVQVYGPTGSFVFTPASGCGPLTVNFTATIQNTQLLIWDLNNGVTHQTTSNTFSYTYTQAGKYLPKLILSDNASCLVPIQINDTIKVDHLDADFSFTPGSLCNSGTVQFTDTVLNSLSDIITRNWTFGDGGISNAHNPSHNYALPGVYTVRLIIGNTTGCPDTITKNISIHALPNVSAGPSQAVCQGQVVPLNIQAAGAINYLWTPANGLSCTNCANPSALPSATTTYIVTGIDTNGCSDTGMVTITINQKPTVNAGNNQTICAGNSASLLATGATNYNWSPAIGLSCTSCANPTANPTVNTIYKVVGSNIYGCKDSATTTITVNALPAITTGSSQTICKGDSAQLNANGGISYSWFPATALSCNSCNNPKASPAATTIYTVTGMGSNGCTATSQITVTVNPLPVINAGKDTAICDGGIASLQATGGINYLWTPATGLSCTTCANPTANINTTTTYTLKGTDVNGCTNTNTVTATVNPIPVVNATGGKTVCMGIPIPLLATGATNYSWAPTSGLSCTTCPNPNATPSSTTNYIVTGTAKGCSDTASVTVTILPLPNVSAGADITLCTTKAVNLQATGAKTYIWSPANGLSCTNCSNPTANPLITTTYTITGTNDAGCTNTAQLTITLRQLPIVNAGEDQTICLGSKAQLQANGANSYIWTPADFLSCTNCSNPTADPISNITYKVTGTDIYGCSNSDEVTVSVIEKTPITFSNGDTLCKGESTQLYVTGGSDYQWIPSTGLSDAKSASPTASPETTTVYNVIVLQGDCFTDTGHITVVVHELPNADAGPDKNIIAGNNVQLQVQQYEKTKYTWSPAEELSCADCYNPLASPKRSTKYTVSLTNEWNCTANDDITVFVTCAQDQLFVANTFTPNGDGVNDQFYPQGKGIADVKQMSIYNRWGQVVFSTQNMPLNDPLYGWDGRFKGEQLDADVFVYVIHATCSSGEPIELKGDISLIR